MRAQITHPNPKSYILCAHSTQPCFKFILFYTFVGNVAAYSKLMTHLDIIQASSIPVPASAKEFTMCKFPKNLIFILFFSFSAHTHTHHHTQLGNSAELSLGLRILHVTIPSAVESGEMAQLVCDHDTEDEALYAVKWYKGAREFFRYTPKEIPAVKIFSFPGLHIDVSIKIEMLVRLCCRVQCALIYLPQHQASPSQVSNSY